jgi:hypothetical protein
MLVCVLIARSRVGGAHHVLTACNVFVPYDLGSL